MRCFLGSPHENNHLAVTAPWTARGLASDLHRECPRNWCLNLSHGSRFEGYRTGDCQLMVKRRDRADRRDGDDPSRYHLDRGGAATSGHQQVHEGRVTILQPLDQSMISISNLTVSYGDYVAVKGVSFDVRRGEHVTLLGPSGCGKTTTLRSVAGLERPCGGAIQLDGRTVYSA